MDPQTTGGKPISFQPTGAYYFWHRFRNLFKKKTESNLVKHARRELALMGHGDDEMQAAINAHIITMVKAFSEEGHSGFSASYAIWLLEKLLRFEPLLPLSGEESEWTKLDYGDDMGWQNNRCSHIFKGTDGRAYDSEGKIFRDKTGCFTSRDSRVYITFPYTPKREYVDVERAA